MLLLIYVRVCPLNVFWLSVYGGWTHNFRVKLLLWDHPKVNKSLQKEIKFYYKQL